MKKYIVENRVAKVKKVGVKLEIVSDEPTMDRFEIFDYEEAFKTYKSYYNHLEGIGNYYKGGYYVELLEEIEGEVDTIESQLRDFIKKEEEKIRRDNVLYNLEKLVNEEIEIDDIYDTIICAFEDIYDNEEIIVNKLEGDNCYNYTAYANNEESALFNIRVEVEEEIIIIKEISSRLV